MRPRRIATMQETTEMLDCAVRENALAVLSTQPGSTWVTFKSRFLERDPSRQFIVLDYQETHGVAPPPLILGQYVGVSFRHKSRKIMFGTVVEAKGRFLTGEQASITAIRYRWPEGMTELQRRAYQRTFVPAGTAVPVTLWPGGAAARGVAQSAAEQIVTGEACDISCGGALIRMNQLKPVRWKEDQTLGVELHLPDGRPPVMVNAYFRGARPDESGSLCAAVQFVGLELSDEGGAILQRLARCVQKFHRQSLAAGLRTAKGNPV